MTPGTFRVLRRFYLRDEKTGVNAVVEPDALVEISDAQTIIELIGCGKIKPADYATQARIQPHPEAGAWTVAAPDAGAPPPAWTAHR